VTHSSLAALTALATLVSGPLVTHAEPILYTPDRWHTRIYFTVSHMGLSNYGGRFVEHDIKFMFDEEQMENSSIEVTVPVASIDTFSPELNRKMPNPEFFDTENHPNIHFISTEIEQLDATTARMTGDLTIKGVTLPITFDVIYNNKVMHPFFKLNNIGFSAVAKLDNRAYGVNPLPDWMLASTVEVRVEMEAFEGDKVPYYSKEQ
jgi:polyisoprenoid-binding protein YceI